MIEQSRRRDLHFSEHLACPEHGSVLPEIEPRTFSFNTPHGACPDCQGLGSKLEIDPDCSSRTGTVSERRRDRRMEWSGPREEGGYYWQSLEAVAQALQDRSGCARSQNCQRRSWTSSCTAQMAKRSRCTTATRMGAQHPWKTAFEGVIGNLERRYRETNSEYIARAISEFMSDQPCPTCNGARLRPGSTGGDRG